MSGVTQVKLARRQMRWRSACTRRCLNQARTTPGRSWKSWPSGSSPVSTRPGERLRAVAAELVGRGLEVTAVDYRDGSPELEVVLASARRVGSVTVDRDGSGRGCQISWEEWVNIADEAGVRRAADIVDAVLRGVAGPAR